MSLLRALPVLALSCTIGCGVIDGVKGTDKSTSNLAARSWHGPQQLDSGGGQYPRLAYGQGTLWATWWNFDRGANIGRGYVTRRVGTGSFETPVAVPDMAAQQGGLVYPQIAVGPVGDPVLVFEELSAISGATYSMWGGRLSAGTTISTSLFSRLDFSSSNTPQMSQRNAVAVDNLGNALFAWGEAGTQYAVTASRTSAFSQPQTVIVDNVFGGAETQVAMGDNGSALIALSSGTSTIAQPVDASGGLFTAASQQVLTTGTSQDQGAPAVAMRGTHGVAAFRALGGGAISVQPYDNGTWGTTHTITDAQLSYYYGVETAVNAKGQTVVCWRHTLPGSTAQYAGAIMCAFYDGAAWSTPQVVSAAIIDHKAWWTSIGINDQGFAIVSWADFESTGTYTRIFASRLDLSASAPAFGAPEAIDLDQPGAGLAGTPENVRNITVEMDPAGSAAYVSFIAHENDSQTTTHVYVNWLE